MEVLNVQRGDTCLDIRIIAFTICLGNIALRTCNCSGVGGKAVGSVIVCLLGIGRGDNNRYLTLELGVVVGGLCFGKGVCTYIQTLPLTVIPSVKVLVLLVGDSPVPVVAGSLE